MLRLYLNNSKPILQEEKPQVGDLKVGCPQQYCIWTVELSTLSFFHLWTFFPFVQMAIL